MGHNQRKHCGPIQAEVRKKKYAKQFAITEANRKRKRLKHLAFNPHDIQLLARMKSP